MNYADRYNGKLLLIHGIIDENVHMQNTIQLATVLQEKQKKFDMMLYSGARHGWSNLAALWKHYNTLRDDFIYKELMGK